MAKNARDVMEKWSRNLANSGESMRAGIESVTESPTRKAAASLDNYREGVMRSLDSGKTKAAMEAVTLEDWQEAALEKGVAHATAAARSDRAKNAVLNFQEQFLPFVESVSDKVRKMPKGTLADGIARMVAQVEGVSKFKYTKRR